MKVVDLNLLIYAVNQDAPKHERTKAWWEACLSGAETIGLPWVVLLGFLRITTHSGIMPCPLSCHQATGLMDTWLDQEAVQIITPAPKHWTILKKLILSSRAVSNLTTDVHLAALTIEKRGILYTSDSDFSRFPDLRWENPIAG